MNKKQFLELLIRSFDLEPIDIKHYRTQNCDGACAIGTGWSGQGVNKKHIPIIDFYEPDGFSMAVYEILRQGKGEGCRIVYVEPPKEQGETP